MANENTDELRAKVEDLMKYGVAANVEELDQIYHDDLVVMNLTIDGQFVTLSKQDVLGMLTEVFAGLSGSAYMWSKIHSISVDGDRGHVLISRKLPIGGPQMHIDLSIDFTFEDSRWQVTREVNFVRPDLEAA
ncbi:MAG: nuclear transport factor 2 family protein [Roseovarius sp.]|nr:nuclear transport factor 2 family protein [Roseovarius sp.]